jgi:hypothetical protein
MSAIPATPIQQPPRSAPRAAQYIERRLNNRQSLSAIGVIADQSDGHFRNQLQVLVQNISTGGLGFRAPVAFGRGFLYGMRIGTGPLHLKARLQIVSSRVRSDGGFDVGAKFV